MITSLFAPRWRTVWLCLLLLVGQCVAKAATTNPEAISQLLNRIGGDGTADRFVTVVDASLSTDGNDVFVLTSHDGKPCIKGNTTLSVATGINWYLNHVAHVNLTWNNLTTNLAAVSLPAPAQEERHDCHADYRYYLNYCTFSYSMSTWTWERWQQEIDWMALHGINMPLQIVGLDVVWYKLLTQDLGYTEAEANNFIAGPCFQAWWGMNNLEGWGGPNPAWWYTRQEQLCKKILERQRELGMEPVLPGYSGMVPSDITTKGYTANNQGNWCSFVRPYILDPNSQAFTDITAKYYARLAEVMGMSKRRLPEYFEGEGRKWKRVFLIGMSLGGDEQRLAAALKAMKKTEVVWISSLPMSESQEKLIAPLLKVHQAKGELFNGSLVKAVGDFFKIDV